MFATPRAWRSALSRLPWLPSSSSPRPVARWCRADALATLTTVQQMGLHAVQLHVAAERGPGAYRPDTEAWHDPTISAFWHARRPKASYSCRCERSFRLSTSTPTGGYSGQPRRRSRSGTSRSVLIAPRSIANHTGASTGMPSSACRT
jgi:hypothetical protein